MSREANHRELRQLDSKNRLFASIQAFLKAVDVVENELLDPATMPEPLGSVLTVYYRTLDRYRPLTYGQQVVRAVTELEHPELAGEVRAQLRHLIVDEYQDVNPAQEPHRPTGRAGCGAVRGGRRPPGHLPVAGVGCLQHRGLRPAYPSVATFAITTNRRSGPGPEVVVWSAPTEADEAGWIAGMIEDLVDAGLAYRDIAILVRSRAAYAALTTQFAAPG